MAAFSRWVVGVGIEEKVQPSHRLLLCSGNKLAPPKQPRLIVLKVYQPDEINGTRFRKPPIKGRPPLSSGRFGPKTGFHLDRDRPFLFGRIGNQIDASICRHRRRFDPAFEQPILNQ
jgi:hypothetical protein